MAPTAFSFAVTAGRRAYCAGFWRWYAKSEEAGL
jgi:hypothetical protein